jgi:hypothetical protein
MFMNYMDYVDDRAMVMFSTGQVARMQACLDGVRSAIGNRAGAIRPSSSPVLASLQVPCTNYFREASCRAPAALL